jgi:hypothetical protein
VTEQSELETLRAGLAAANNLVVWLLGLVERSTAQPGSREGERCFCGKPAAHKVEEVDFADDPQPIRHPLTSYVCREHFREIMGPAAG